jgi:hypothetical protein
MPLHGKREQRWSFQLSYFLAVGMIWRTALLVIHNACIPMAMMIKQDLPPIIPWLQCWVVHLAPFSSTIMPTTSVYNSVYTYSNCTLHCRDIAVCIIHSTSHSTFSTGSLLWNHSSFRLLFSDPGVGIAVAGWRSTTEKDVLWLFSLTQCMLASWPEKKKMLHEKQYELARGWF